jgi:hypothetical protein
MPACLKDAYRSPIIQTQVNEIPQTSERLGDFNNEFKLPKYVPPEQYPLQMTPTWEPKKDDTPMDDCEELIARVLNNRYCRQILRRIFASDTTSCEQCGGGRRTEDRISTESAESTASTASTEWTSSPMIIYCLVGLLILCVLEILFKMGQKFARS